jgi:hypothetical protein
MTDDRPRDCVQPKSRRIGWLVVLMVSLAAGTLLVLLLGVWAAIRALHTAPQGAVTLTGESLDELPLSDAGKTPEATLNAYYRYKDRGQFGQLHELVINDPSMPIAEGSGAAMSAQAQQLRGIVLDSAKLAPGEATLYYRTWFSRATALQGGRPTIAKLVLVDGRWKIDLKETLRLTANNTRGKTQLGFFDGDAQWFEPAD